MKSNFSHVFIYSLKSKKKKKNFQEKQGTVRNVDEGHVCKKRAAQMPELTACQQFCLLGAQPPPPCQVPTNSLLFDSVLFSPLQ